MLSIQWRIYIQKFPAPLPKSDPILSFLHTFLPKSAHIGGWHPQLEILDPPPLSYMIVKTDVNFFCPFTFNFDNKLNELILVTYILHNQIVFSYIPAV